MTKSCCVRLLLFIVFINYQVQARTKSHFHSDDTSYSYSVTIHTSQYNCIDLSNYLYIPESFRQLSPLADSISITRIDTLSQIVEVYFSKWLYRGYSRYSRVLSPGKFLSVNLLKFEHNWSAIPRVKTASIQYDFHSGDDGCTVRYHQRVTADRKIGIVYRKMIQLQMDIFARNLETLIRRAGK